MGWPLPLLSRPRCHPSRVEKVTKEEIILIEQPTARYAKQISMQSKYRRNLWHLTRLVLVFRMDIADLFVWTNTVGLNSCYQYSDPVILHPLYTHPLASSIYEHWCQRHRFCIHDRYVDIKMEKGETVTSRGHLVVLLGFETSRAKSSPYIVVYSSSSSRLKPPEVIVDTDPSLSTESLILSPFSKSLN